MVIEADKTIEYVVRSGLCTGCGTCVGICPQSALKMVRNKSKGIFLPELDQARCSECGICFKVCPGHAVDFKVLNLQIFGREPKDVLIGNYLNWYTGHAIDYGIRYNSASGGLITALLVFALEEGIIDGALVTRMKDKNPLEPQPIIARTRGEIVRASKSKYCPVPANIALEEILKGNGRFAVVGLPCHIQGIRKAGMTNRRLKERIAIHLGIFCLHTDNFWGTTFLLQKWGVKKENIAQLDYRGEGWPGFMAIHMRNGTKKLIAFDDMIRLLHMYGFFTPMRCTLCCDYTCELADISFGDAWLPELKNDNIGKSMIISRSESGESLLQNAVAKTKIQLDKISRNKVVQAQAPELAFKKSLKARTPFSRLLVKKMPIYNTELLEPKLRAYLDGIWCYLRIYLGSKRYLWGLPFVCESISGTLGRIRDTTSTGK